MYLKLYNFQVMLVVILTVVIYLFYFYVSNEISTGEKLMHMIKTERKHRNIDMVQ
jgi:hypothetical protein